MEGIPFSQHPAANVAAKTALGTHGVTLHGRQGGVGVDCHPHHPPLSTGFALLFRVAFTTVPHLSSNVCFSDQKPMKSFSSTGLLIACHPFNATSSVLFSNSRNSRPTQKIPRIVKFSSTGLLDYFWGSLCKPFHKSH